MKFLKLTIPAMLLLPLGAAAQHDRYQDRDWNRYDRPYDNLQMDNIARRLSDSATSLWNMVRYRSDFRDPQRIYLYDSIRDFARTARYYRASPSDRRARQLVNQAEDIGRFVDRNALPYDFRSRWSVVQDQVSMLSRYYGIPFDYDRNLARTDRADSGGHYRERNGVGIFRWRGRVDGTDIIFLHGNQVQIRHEKSRPITDASFDLPSPLPFSPVNVQLRRVRGRGRVQVIQEPSRSNDYTAGVLIEDDQGGSDLYEFELLW
jgi:hypothetical protein